MENTYFIITHNNRPDYLTILDIKKKIYDYYGVNYVEGIVIRDKSRILKGDLNKRLILTDIKSPTYVHKYFTMTFYRI